MSEEAGSRSSRKLTDAEIRDFLKRGFWGVLATSVNDEPYGVPVIYGLDDEGVIYIANRPGRKIEMLRQNPRVTLTVVEVEDFGQRWRSVIVYGAVEVVRDTGEKLHAFNALRKQVPRASVRVSDAARLAMAKVVKIVPSEITGRCVE